LLNQHKNVLVSEPNRNGWWRKVTKFWRYGSFLFIILAWAVSGCGGGSSGGQSQGAPFDTAKGEGVLQSTDSVVTYSTGGTGSEIAEDSSLPALNTFYMTTICPSSLSPAQCTQNQTNLNTAQFGNFDLSKDPIGDNPLGITEVDGVKVTYGALNVGGVPVTVSGGIAIPETDTPKGIILFFHGTTVQRSVVPSNFVTDTNPNGDSDGMLLGATWASQGYIVVMPDYIGLGDDVVNPHPYVVYDKENAQSGLAMVKAVRDSLADKNRLPLYITGYSEGGAYALEAGHRMQSNSRYASALNVTLKNVTPISGAFDLTGSQLPFLFDNVQSTGPPWFVLNPITTALGKPYLSADLALSFSIYDSIAPTVIMASGFYNCANAIKSQCGDDGTLTGLYYQQMTLSNTAITLLVVSQAGQVGYGLSNSISPLLTATYNQQLMDQDPTNPLYAALLAADTYLFVPKFPLALVSLQMDSVVTRVNSDVAYIYMTGKNPTGPYQEQLVDNNEFLTPGLFAAGPIDHTSELPFLAILALNQFNLNP
jgi:hypothetical protein